MRPGPELDAAIARMVWRQLVVVDTQSGEYHVAGPGRPSVPRYSTDQAAAELVVNHFQGLGWTLKTRRSGGQVAASFIRPDTRSTYRFFFADTLPSAICHAAIAVHNGTIVQSK